MSFWSLQRAYGYFVGYEINQDYVKLAERRIKKVLSEGNSPKLFDNA